MFDWAKLKIAQGRVTPAYWNKLIDAIRQISLCPGVGYRLSETPSGTTLLIDGSSGSGVIPPFKIFTRPNPSNPDDNIDVSIHPGTLNFILPENWDEVFTISKTGDFYVVLNAETNGEYVTGVEISIESISPSGVPATAEAAPTEFAFLIGVIIDGRVFQTHTGNVSFEPYEVLRTDKPSPLVGQSPWRYWYNWRLVT